MSDAEVAMQIARASETVEAISTAYFNHRAADGGFESPLKDFVPLLHEGDNYMKQECVDKISSLASFDTLAQYHFVLNDVVEPLVELLKDGELDGIRKGAIKALRNIGVENDSAATRVSMVGGSKALVEIVRSGTEALKHDAIEAIWVLAQKLKSIQMNVVSGGGIPVLVGVLSTGSPSMQAYALQILDVVARCTEEFQTQMIDAGVMKPAIELMKVGCGPEGDISRYRAAKLVLAFGMEASKNAFFAAGVVEPLVAMLGEGSFDERSCAALVMGNLVSETRPIILDTPAAESLIHFVIDGDEDRGTNVAVVVKLTYYTAENRSILVGHGIVEPLLHLMRSGDDREKTYATAALGNLVWKHPTNQEIVLASGAADLLLDLLRSGAEEQRRLAANALGDFVAKKPAIQQAVFHGGAAPFLVELVKSGSGKSPVDGTRTLGKLAADNEPIQTSLGDMGAVEALTDLLWASRTLSTEVRVATTRALRKLAANHTANQTRIVDARVVDTLIAQWRTGEAKEKRLAGEVLSQVAWHPTAFVMIEGLGASEAISEHNQSDEGETKANE